jgi:hypothetical protein
LAEVHGPATYCGYPGVGRRVVHDGISFGIVSMGAIVSSSHGTLISIQIDRENLVRIVGEGDMPEDFNFAGISGGPLIAIIQAPIVRTWKPAGVVISGPDPGDNPEQDFISGFEVIRVRPIHFINADGTLDRTHWQQTNIRETTQSQLCGGLSKRRSPIVFASNHSQGTSTILLTPEKVN